MFPTRCAITPCRCHACDVSFKKIEFWGIPPYFTAAESSRLGAGEGGMACDVFPYALITDAETQP
eukprot:4328533-Prymnesium_polylepis.1